MTTNMAAGGKDRALITVLKSKPLVLNLSNKDLKEISPAIGRISSIKSLILKSNVLSDLPIEVAALAKLENVNLGNNILTKLPSVFQYTHSVKTLHLFNNSIEVLDSVVICGLRNLTLLNLNNNRIKELPPQINRLPYLKVLSLDHNKITELPCEICHLSELEELNLNSNLLQGLPFDIAFLRKLKKLNLRKNRIEVIPDGLCQCNKLQVLDVAGNRIKSFPAEFEKLPLKELYCEENNLLRHLPVRSTQGEEVLTLKELTGRFISTALKDSTSDMRVQIKFYPELEEMLKSTLSCAVCGEPFLNTWLECVQFVDGKKMLGTRNNPGIVPVRGLLCSYTCFNRGDHDFFGIAHVES